jgi:mannosyl-glycoprotein endo-beta-N-acetylglucosaminidase
MNKTLLSQAIIKTEEPRKPRNVIKKAIIPSFCFAVLSTAAFEEVVHAAESTSAKVTVNSQLSFTTKYVNVASGSLNLRATASTSGSIITSLSKGTAVTVYSEANGWAKVSANGKDGFVSTSFLSSANPTVKPSSPATASVTKYVNVTSGSLNLRATASTSGSVITSLSKGTAVTVYSEANGWAKVSANGKDGFVSTSFLSAQGPNGPVTTTPATVVTKYVNVASGSLNMRNGASTSSSIIVGLAKGTAVKVYSESGGWAKIEVYGKTGYVSSAFLAATIPGSNTGTGTVPPAQQITTKYVNVKTGSSLNVRKSASTSSAILIKLPSGTEVKVQSESNGWAKIQVNGVEGYVSSEFLSTSKSNPAPPKEEQQTSKTMFVNVSLGSTLSMYNSVSTNASILVKLARGVEVTVYSEENGWSKIEAYGKTGYVSSEFLSETKPATGEENTPDNNPDSNNVEAVTKYIDVIYGSSLNLRSAASTSAAVITKLARGTIVTVHSEENGWSRVTANGQTGYVSSQYLSKTAPFNPNTTNGTIEKVYESYNISLNDLTKKQMAVNPQTDKKYKTYISTDAVTVTTPTSGNVNGTGWNVRGGAGTDYWVVGQVNNQDSLQILSTVKDTAGNTWYEINYNKAWVNASPEDVAYFVDPNNFLSSTVDSLQFLKLSASANIDAVEINERILSGKGILQGLASAFITAGDTFGINEIYLISHALLETGNGTSQLAKGVQINGKTVYNMYGIGAYDNSALNSGAQFAYNAGWFTPEAAIIGGAQFIGNGYINAGQDTLYKMRWNPGSVTKNGYASHQYATDIGWAAKQVNQINNIYSLLDSYKLVLEIPQFK